MRQFFELPVLAALCISAAACATASTGESGPGVLIEQDGASSEGGAAAEAGAGLPDATLDDGGPDTAAPPPGPDAGDASDGASPEGSADSGAPDGGDAAVVLRDASSDGAVCGSPSGSYTGSCTGCVVTAGTLTCNCKTGSGSTTAPSSLDLCACPDTTTISNASGVLTCCGNPGGSYTSSCNECATTATILGCTCKTSNGGVISSFLPLCTCQPPKQIANTNGILTCQ